MIKQQKHKEKIKEKHFLITGFCTSLSNSMIVDIVSIFFVNSKSLDARAKILINKDKMRKTNLSKPIVIMPVTDNCRNYS